jgi:hypothetical protein
MGKQKLSPKAAKAKAVRDLACANTDDRKAKRADSQMKRRKAVKNNGLARTTTIIQRDLCYRRIIEVEHRVRIKKTVQRPRKLKINHMKSRGLGDTIEKLTTVTGIKRLVDKIPGECGCKKRKELLNKAFPYKE